MDRLRFQLVAVLVLAILLPLPPAAFVARELFGRSLDTILASGLSESAEAGLAVTRDAILAEKVRWSAALRAGASLDTLAPAAVLALRLHEREARPAPVGVEAPGRITLLRDPELVWRDSLAVLVGEVRGSGGVAVWVSETLADTLALRARAIERGARLLATLRRERIALLGGIQTTFLAVYLGLALLVLGVGLVLVSRLTRPLARLALGIDRVAAGDLTARVPAQGSAEVRGLMQRFNDMTARLETQQQELGRLERLAAWRGMARALAHEIKNPLTPIQLAAEQMRDTYRGDDPAYRRLLKEGASIITEEVSGLREWVSEFSQFARLPEVRVAQVASEELAEDLRALYGDSALTVRIAPEARMLRCDRDQMKRVLVNLIDNGRAAQVSAGREAPIEMSLEAGADGGVRLRVRDHGPGVAPENRRRVFEPDYTTKSDGMGLGLAIVETIVHQHGGSIAFVDAAGEGAVVEVLLPGAERNGGPTA